MSSYLPWYYVVTYRGTLLPYPTRHVLAGSLAGLARPSVQVLVLVLAGRVNDDVFRGIRCTRVETELVCTWVVVQMGSMGRILALALPQILPLAVPMPPARWL